jgi:hypothetical protein
MRVHTSIAAFGSNIMKVVFLAGALLLPAACMDGTEQPGVHAENVADFSAAQLDIIPNDEDCATVAAWVIGNEANLPTEYDDIVRFPVAYRRAIFELLSPAARSNLWQRHFQAYLVANPGLSAEQIAFIDEAGAAISPELFAEEAGTAASQDTLERVAALEAEAFLLFPQDQARALLAQLGPDEPAKGYAPEEVDCHCSTVSDWCSDNLNCKKGARDCHEEGGCGKLWMYTCNGMCGP